VVRHASRSATSPRLPRESYVDDVLALDLVERFADGLELRRLVHVYPELGRVVTVVSTEGEKLQIYQEHWLEILGDWYDKNGDAVAEEQEWFSGKQPF